MATRDLEIQEAEVTALVQQPAQLVAPRALEPEEQLAQAERIAKLLKSYLDRKKKEVIFNGERYPEADDWNFVAAFFGTTAKTRWTKVILEDGEIVGYECAADLIRDSDGMVVCSAEASCSRTEPNWARKPDFQLRAMAQTRATARACKQKYSWVMVMAGLRPTPAEEMGTEVMGNGNGGGNYVQSPQRKSQPTTADHKAAKKVTESQLARLHAIAGKRNVPHDDIGKYAHATFSIESLKELNMKQYDELVQWVEAL